MFWISNRTLGRLESSAVEYAFESPPGQEVSRHIHREVWSRNVILATKSHSTRFTASEQPGTDAFPALLYDRWREEVSSSCGARATGFVEDVRGSWG